MYLCTVHDKDGLVFWDIPPPRLSIPLPCLAYCYIALHCIPLCCIAFHCIALHSTALHYIPLHCITFRCIALLSIALYCLPSHCIAFHCIALLFTALHCFPLHCIEGTNSVSSPPVWNCVWKEKFNTLNQNLFCTDESLLWVSVNRKILNYKDQMTNYVSKWSGQEYLA